MNLGPETEYVEHKRSTGELREGMESIASILNKHGHGTLFFGVRNDGEVVGQDVSDSTLRKVSQAIGSSISPTIFPRVEACDDDGRGYIKVSFEGDEAPYSCNGRFRMRVADEDLMMSDEELRSQVLRAQARRVPWDQWESPRPISDVDEEELRSFVERGNACGRIAESFTAVEDTLGRLKLLRNGRLTNAAEVLFCPSRTAALKMGILATHSRTEILDIVQEEGTLFHLVRAAERYILVNTRRKVIVDGVGPREEVPELPPAAVREVPFNAFAHRDWTSRACVQVDIFADSVEITNPGWFIEGQNPADHISGVDHSWNDLIVTTLHKSRDIEAYGTGIPRIRDTCAEAGGGVRVRARADWDEVRLPSGRPVLRRRLAGNGRQRPTTADNGRQRPESLTENDRRILEFLRLHGTSPTALVSEELGIPARTARTALRRLADAGLVERLGANRNRTYRAI